MASVIVTSRPLSGLEDLDGAKGRQALKEGMVAFGDEFHDRYRQSRDQDALIETFFHVLDDLDYHVYAISPEGADRALIELSGPRYNDDESAIIFDVNVASGARSRVVRKFRIVIREDRKLRMNVYMPIFGNAFTYLDNLVTIIQGTDPGESPLGADDAKKLLLATSMISRCK